jgi:MerR family transcriptional regulator, mercuric resistance operon regulatory protein
MKRLTIGTLAVASGVKVTTIRFYERAGLMPPPTRTAGSHRNYTNAQLQRLLFICRARELEFSIEDIRMLLTLAEPPTTSCHEVQRLAVIHLNKLRQKIADLMRAEAALASAINQCSGKPISPCPVLELLQSADRKFA